MKDLIICMVLGLIIAANMVMIGFFGWPLIAYSFNYWFGG